MNANDIRLYEQISNQSKKLNLNIKLEGESFALYTKKGGLLGRCENLNDLAHYIYGYDAGFSKGSYAKR